MEDVGRLSLVSLSLADEGYSSIPVLGIPVLHTHLGLRWGSGTGVFVFPISQLASFVTTRTFPSRLVRVCVP